MGGGVRYQKSFNKNRHCVTLFSPWISLCHKETGERGKRSMQQMIHVRGDGGRRTTPFALPIIPLCLLFLFNLLGRIVSMNCLLEPLLRR